MNRKFSNEFKIMVVDLINSGDKTVSEICSFFDIDRQVIHNWLKLYKVKGEDAFNSSIPAPHETEYKKIQAELKEAQEENEILKKACAYFGKAIKR